MKILIIDKKEYELKNDWSDFTFNEFQPVLTVVNDFPEWLKNKCSTDEKAVYERKQFNDLEYHTHLGNLIAVCSNIPQATIERIFPDDRSDLYAEIVHFAGSILSKTFYAKIKTTNKLDMYIPNPATEIILNKKKYPLGKDKRVLGVTIPVASLEAKNFVEALDYRNMVLTSKLSKSIEAVEIGELDHLPMIAAILTVTPYNEDEILKRNELFYSLKMNTLIDVFFYSTVLKITLLVDVQNSSHRVKVTVKEQPIAN